MAKPRTSLEGKMIKAAVEEGAAPGKTAEINTDACMAFCAALAGFEGGDDPISWYYTHFPRFGRIQARQFAVFCAAVAESPEKAFHKSALAMSGLRWGQVFGMMKADPQLNALYNAAMDSRQALASALLVERVIKTAEDDCARVTTVTDKDGNLVSITRMTDPRTLLDVLSRFDRARFGDSRNAPDKAQGGGGGGPQFHIDRVPREKIVEERKREKAAATAKTKG